MPDVYEPAEDSFLIQKHVKKFAKGSVLELGTGSGILAREAAKTAKSVLAADINPDALSAAKKAAKEARAKNIAFRKSDLFSKIQGKFDCIIFNPPYLPSDEKNPDLALDGGKKGCELILRFVENASEHLKEDGTILLLFSSLSRPGTIAEALEDHLFNFELVDQQHVFFEDLFVYAITKSPLLRAIETEGIAGVKKFARGKRGVIYLGKKNRLKIAVKTAKTDATAKNILHEGEVLRKLNRLKIGPKLVVAKPSFFAYEFVEGDFILDFAEKASKKRLIAVVKDALKQCRKLDEAGISKFEMTRPIKHIIVQNRPVMIDFERARKTAKPKNVTQFASFVAKGALSKILAEKGVKIDAEKILQLAKEYKKKPAREAFNRILKEI